MPLVSGIMLITRYSIVDQTFSRHCCHTKSQLCHMTSVARGTINLKVKMSLTGNTEGLIVIISITSQQ